MAQAAVPRTVAVFAIQGDYAKHARAVAELGAGVVLARTAEQLRLATHLILPGGESSTMLKFIEREGLGTALRELHARGCPILATCAGVILLAREVRSPAQSSLNLLDVVVERNAYGRQIASFVAPLACPALGPAELEAVFIRAPVLRQVGPQVSVLASLDTPVLVRQDRVLGATFHPELTPDSRVHRYFLEMDAA